MRNVRQLSLSRYLLLGVLPVAAAFNAGCLGQVGGNNTTTGGGTTGSSAGNSGGSGIGGPGGAAGMAPPCTGPSDPRMVVAPQRIMRLTGVEAINTVNDIVNPAEAAALLAAGILPTDETNPAKRNFPPLGENSINSGNYQTVESVASHARDYILANFATATGCTTVNDSCATTWLNGRAAIAYRRALTSEEQSRFTALYNKLKSQNVRGYQITATVQEATAWSIQALLTSPQLLWRWELGNAAMAQTSPAGIPLTDQELATHLSFYLTDHPPDPMLRMAADGNTLRANLGAQVTRLLATQTAKDWLRTIIETFYLVNKLPDASIDTGVFPLATGAMRTAMATEARMFMDNALWNGNLTDLFLSRTTFVNLPLARDIYKITPPATATDTVFAQATLPSDQRAGILTNSAFITSRGRSDGIGFLIPRGRVIAAAVLCSPPPSPGPELMAAVDAAKGEFTKQTGREQVAYRQSIPLCASCHAFFDPYGLVLENYDNLGIYRTTDHTGKTVDATTALPPVLGGGNVTTAIQLAETLAASPAFTDCMASTMLQYALVQYVESVVELPGKGGCSTADVVQKYNAGSAKTFAALVRATTETPAFTLRRAAQ